MHYKDSRVVILRQNERVCRQQQNRAAAPACWRHDVWRARVSEWDTRVARQGGGGGDVVACCRGIRSRQTRVRTSLLTRCEAAPRRSRRSCSDLRDPCTWAWTERPPVDIVGAYISTEHASINYKLREKQPSFGRWKSSRLWRTTCGLWCLARRSWGCRSAWWDPLAASCVGGLSSRSWSATGIAPATATTRINQSPNTLCLRTKNASKTYFSRHNLLVDLNWLISEEGRISSCHFINEDSQRPPVHCLVVALYKKANDV